MILWFREKAHRLRGELCAHRLFYIFALFAMLAAGVFACILHARTLPFAEGWYTYYSQCIHGGLVPYRDFEYLYSPIYLYFIAFFTKIFGYELIALRRLGVVIFALIALGIYLSVSVITGRKRSWIALVAAIAAVFYMQSEPVQIFYDYVRVMDMIAAFSLLFLLLTVRAILNGNAHRGQILTLGFLCGIFINIKQNIGLIFLVYTLILLIYTCIWARRGLKKTLLDICLLLLPTLCVEAAVCLCLAAVGALGPYFSMTGFGAAGAKGGMHVILFGWIPNNVGAFLTALPLAVAVLALILALYLTGKRNRFAVQSENIYPVLGAGFAALTVFGIFLMTLSKNFTVHILFPYFYSCYSVFLTVCPLFIACGVWGIVDMVHKKNTMRDVFLLFALSGAYFAIAYGCGNSGGLAEGQSAFGIAFIVTALLSFVRLPELSLARRKVPPTQVALCLLFLLVTLQSAGKKMVHTYDWWGMDESDYWSSTEEIDIPLLNGIRVSPETKAVYESIYHAISQNTGEDDTILAFPQLPLFYTLCNRSDPGLFAKVQWFDVSSDKAVLEDIESLKENPPRAVLIYNTSDFAYTSHENAFRGGNTSGTRIMREFLHNYVAENGYRFCGRYITENNSLSLWIADPEGTTPKVSFAGGTGTAEDPYLISDAQQLQMFAQMVNAGRSFEGQYIRQCADIDLSDVAFSPIGEVGLGAYFKGVYDGSGHVIRHLAINGTGNIGLFGALAGTVCNLGITDSAFYGDCVGGIAGTSFGEHAKIINCFTDIEMTGFRTAGIADDFSGEVCNSVSLGELTGQTAAGALTLPNAKKVVQVYTATESLHVVAGENSTDDRVQTLPHRQDLGNTVLADLNRFVDEQNETAAPVPLCHWQLTEDGTLALIPQP